MKRNEVLIVEISGKRPGDASARPTEKIKTRYDHIIVSNNSENYESDWEIVNVPKEYETWYREKVAFTNFWQAPMNRSYAIKLARERGYKFCVQLDDNILELGIAYSLKESEAISLNFRKVDVTGNASFFDDMVAVLVEVLRRSNAAVSGMNLASVMPGDDFAVERFVYSFFCIQLDRCPDVFHGCFEDDIEFRLKCAQMGVHYISLPFMNYGKVSAKKTGDVSGCRQAYKDAGLKRGEKMLKLYGDVYSCGFGRKICTHKKTDGEKDFEHRLRMQKIGVLTSEWWRFERKVAALLRKNAPIVKPYAKIYEEAE